MKKCYQPRSFGAKSLALIERASEIIEEYQRKGFVLTLRQLYYQFVSRDLLPNRQSEYKRLGSIINDARYAGLIDWEALEDRTRNLVSTPTWGSPADIVTACAAQFATDWWDGQKHYVEAWIEKDALLGVLEAAAEPWQLPYFSCRGYTSASEVWGAARRIGRVIDRGRKAIVLHMGDHDPSGLDMSRDIEARIRLFLAGDGIADQEQFELRRIALNRDQIDEYDPPPNPAKTTDSRYASYEVEHGDESWELDALSPEVIARLVEDQVRGLLDEEAWGQAKAAQAQGRTQLQAVSQRWSSVVDLVKRPAKRGRN